MPTYSIKPNYLAVFVGIVILIGCKPVQKNISEEDQTIIEKLGLEFESYPSPSGSYLLFVEKLSPSAANPITKFIVIESVSQKIMIEKSFRPGYVKWIGDSVIELLDVPAILKQNEDSSYYVKKIDLVSNKY